MDTIQEDGEGHKLGKPILVVISTFQTESLWEIWVAIATKYLK